MAISGTGLIGNGLQATQSIYTTASVTPSSDNLVLVAVISVLNSALSTPTLTGNGLTYVQIGSPVDFGAIATPEYRFSLFRALGASPSAGAITITHSLSMFGCLWTVSQFSGIDTGGTNGSAAIVQSATNRADTATSLTATLAAFADAANGCYGAFGLAVNNSVSQGAGFTALDNFGIGTLARLSAQWRVDNDTTVDASFASSNVAGFAVEIKAAQTVANNQLAWCVA